LALALGRTVAELEETMSSSEFSEWLEYYELSPFGAWRDNYHSAQIASLIYNANRGKSNPMGIDNFMYMDRETAEQRREAEFIASLDAGAVKKNG